MDSFVSIVVPAYNEAADIVTCVESLKAQDIPSDNYEIIVVDNGSTDNTPAIVKNLNVNFTIEHKKKCAAAKNAGVRIARGDIIVFIDAHSIALRNWLRNIVLGFQDPSVGSVAGEILPLKRKRPTELEKFLIEKCYLSQEQAMKHPFMPFATGSNSAYRKIVFDSIGLFDDDIFGEDADLSWRMQLSTRYKLVHVKEAVVYHPYERDPLKLFRQKRRHAFGSVMLYKKYKKYRQGEVKSIRRTYWEYCSIIRRWMRLLFPASNEIPAGGSTISSSAELYQLLLETATKVGQIHGSIKYRVWYL